MTSVLIEDYSTAGLGTQATVPEAYYLATTVPIYEITTASTSEPFLSSHLGVGNSQTVGAEPDLEAAFSEWSEESLATAVQQFEVASASWPIY